MTDIKREIQPDYSAYLEDPKHLEDEIVAWELPRHVAEQQALASDVLRVCRRFGLQDIVEVGCGIGWLTHYLPPEIDYIGMDASREVLKEAMKRNTHPLAHFILGDVRTLADAEYVDVTDETHDLVCSFSMLKHFGLHEWLDVATKVLSLGRFACFTLRTDIEDSDEPTQFHNVWIGDETFRELLKRTHSHILWRRAIWEQGSKWEGVMVTGRGEVE